MSGASPVTRVERACTDLTASGHPVTFTAVADRAQLSRTTLYRNPDLRAVVEEHRTNAANARNLSGLATEIAHLRTAMHAVAERVKNQEERLRRLERSRTERT